MDPYWRPRPVNPVVALCFGVSSGLSSVMMTMMTMCARKVGKRQGTCTIQYLQGTELGQSHTHSTQSGTCHRSGLVMSTNMCST